MEEKKEQERLEKVKGLEKQNKEIDSKMNEIEYPLKGIDSLISEANDRMGKAIRSKDMLGIGVAHELQDVATSKQKNAHIELEHLNKRKREITEKLEHVPKKNRKI